MAWARTAIGVSRSFWKAASAASTAWSTVGKTPQSPLRGLPAERAGRAPAALAQLRQDFFHHLPNCLLVGLNHCGPRDLKKPG